MHRISKHFGADFDDVVGEEEIKDERVWSEVEKVRRRGVER